MLISKINNFFARHGRIAMIALLALMVLPLVFLYGVDGLRDMTSGRGGPVATIGDHKVTFPEFEKQRRVTEFMTGGRSNDDRQMAEATIDRILLLQKAKELGIDMVTPDELKKRIKDLPMFQTEEKKFDAAKYRTFAEESLRPRGLSIEFFESAMRDNVIIDRVQQRLAGGTSISDIESFVNFQHGQIRFSGEVARFPGSKYRADIQPTDEEVVKWFKDHEDRYRIEKDLKIAAVRFTAAEAAADEKVSDEALHAFYDSTWSHQIRARHILKKYSPDATAAEKAKVRAAMEKIEAELKGGADFAELAKKESEDTGSGANGGDLDFFGRGRMVKPFEDAAFTLKDGELSPIVETQYGLHIIKRESERKNPIDFETARQQLEFLVRRQLDEAEAAKIWETDEKYKTPQVKARHILLPVALTDSDEYKEGQRKKAVELLAKLKAAPDDFANVAKEQSGDKATAPRGGDMGWFARGSKSASVEDAVFALKDNEFAEVIESPTGFEIIQKTGARDRMPLDEAQPLLAGQIQQKRMERGRKAAEAKAGALIDKLYDAVAGSKEPALTVFESLAAASGVTVEKSDWVPAGSSSIPGISGSTFLLAREVFSLSKQAPLSKLINARDEFYIACFVDERPGYVPEVLEDAPAAPGAKPDAAPAKRLSAAGRKAKNDLIGDLATAKAVEAAKAARDAIAKAIADGKSLADAKGATEFQATGDFNPTYGPTGANGSEIAAILPSLKVGELSEAVEVTNGAVLFYFESKKLPNISEFGERAEMFKNYFERSRAAEVGRALIDSLRKEANIVYGGRLDFMNQKEEKSTPDAAG